MSPRQEGIQRIADLLGDNSVTMENHERSMKSAPGDYSTKIGRGHRNVDLSPQWIVSVFLAGVRNDPKSAATKVPELGNLVPSEIIDLETSRTKFDDPRAGINQLFSMDYTEEKNVHPVFLKENHDTLFDFLCSLVRITGHWLVGDFQEEKCPLPGGLKIQITLEPEQMASVSFFIFENRLIEGSNRAVRHYRRSVSDVGSINENEVIPLERAAVISHAHILRLGGIYALSLDEQKRQIISDAKADTETASKAENKETDNPGRLSAPSETLSHDGSGTTTDTHRKVSLTNSDLSARVCVSSRGSTLKGHSHEHASYHHAVL